jgi:hypothetical protein
VGLKSNGTHQLLAYNDVNILGDSIDTIKKNTETLIDASWEVGLEINAWKFSSGRTTSGLSSTTQFHRVSFIYSTLNMSIFFNIPDICDHVP